MINWIRGWLERRNARRIVSWESCEINIPAWRKKKAEEQFVKTMTEHHMAIFRMQMEANLMQIENQYKLQMRDLRKPARWAAPGRTK